MKKLFVLLCAAACAAVFAFSGCDEGEAFTEIHYCSDDSGITEVNISVSDREIEIGASEDGKVYVDYFDSEKEYLTINLSDDGKLSVKTEYDKKWYDFIGAKPAAKFRKISVKLPDNIISDFAASTSNESIKITRLSFTESVSLEANGGDIVCEGLNAGKQISLKAKNGNITGSVSGGWDDYAIYCKIKKGDCNLPEKKEAGEKTFSADCNNGDIQIEFVK